MLERTKERVSETEFPASLTAARWLAALAACTLAITGCQSDLSDDTSPLAAPRQVSGRAIIPASRSPDYTTAQPPSHQLSKPSKDAQQIASESVILREGDVVDISFPGAPTLNTKQQIRTDGKIALSLVGEVTAAGKTPEMLQEELIKMYQPQLNTKQVVVSVETTVEVYVVGAVLHPGPVTVDHRITALEAVMQAGGFDYTKANLRAVVVIRQEKDRTVRYTLNLKRVMAGSEGSPFYLKPSDVLYVPERFTWF